MFKNIINKSNNTINKSNMINFDRIIVSSSLYNYNIENHFGIKKYDKINDINKNLLVFGLYNFNDYKNIKNHTGNMYIMFTGDDCLSLNNDQLKRLTKLLNNKNIKYLSISKNIYNKLKSINIDSSRIYLDFNDKNVFGKRIKLSKSFIKDNYNNYLVNVQKKYTNNDLININYDKSKDYNKKIICVTCSYKREELLEYMINYLKNINELYKIIVVGSNDNEKNIVDKHDICEYHHFKNKPISNKWNKGVLEAKKHNPDAILIMGSDDIVSKEYLKYSKYLLSDNYDFIGCRSWFTLLKDGDTVIDSALVGYRNNRINNEPIGAGRIISKKILDKLDWNLYKFNTPINKGLDFNSYKKVLNIKDKLKFKIIYPTNTIYMASIKDVKYEHISISHGSSANKNIPGSSWYKWQKNAFSNPYCNFYTDYFIQEINNVKHLENI